MGSLSIRRDALLGGASAAPTPLVNSVLGMLGSGGLAGVVTAAFQQNGLGRLVDSWIGNGQNLPVVSAWSNE